MVNIIGRISIHISTATQAKMGFELLNYAFIKHSLQKPLSYSIFLSDFFPSQWAGLPLTPIYCNFMKNKICDGAWKIWCVQYEPSMLCQTPHDILMEAPLLVDSSTLCAQSGSYCFLTGLLLSISISWMQSERSISIIASPCDHHIFPIRLCSHARQDVQLDLGSVASVRLHFLREQAHLSGELCDGLGCTRLGNGSITAGGGHSAMP